MSVREAPKGSWLASSATTTRLLESSTHARWEQETLDEKRAREGEESQATHTTECRERRPKERLREERLPLSRQKELTETQPNCTEWERRARERESRSHAEQTCLFSSGNKATQQRRQSARPAPAVAQRSGRSPGRPTDPRPVTHQHQPHKTA